MPSAVSLLSQADSNHHKQNQNLLCYHYTIGHTYPLAAAKVRKIWRSTKFFLQKILFYYQQIVVLLTFLCQKILSIDEIFGCNRTILVGQLLLVETYTASLNHFAHLAL